MVPNEVDTFVDEVFFRINEASRKRAVMVDVDLVIGVIVAVPIGSYL